jgi:hypothetical protein
MMGEYIDTVELDWYVRDWFGLCRGGRRRRNAAGGVANHRRAKKTCKSYGCRLVMIEIVPRDLMVFLYECKDGKHVVLLPIDIECTSCFYFLLGKMEKIPNTMLEENGIAIEGDTLKNTFCITRLRGKEKTVVTHLY